jgi:integrase
MPKLSELTLSTDRELKAATAIGKRTDYRVRGVPGLLFRVSVSGSKTWTLVFKSPATGKWSKTALGVYPAVSLTEAKGLAGDMAAEVRKGIDPVFEKRQEALVEIFDDLANRYIRDHGKRNARNGLRSSSTDDAQRILNVDILPLIGPMRVEAVKRQHIMTIVEKVADRGSLTAADRALGTVRAVFNWAIATGRTEHNPTIGLKKRNAGRAKDRVFDHDEIRTFWLLIEDMDGISQAMRDAMRIQLLTAVRIGEVVEARRDEIDFAARVWRIPAIRTKAEREHLLPLSDLALDIFRGAIERADAQAYRRADRQGTTCEPSAWVFPSQRTVGSVLRRDKPLKRQRRTDGAMEPHAVTRCVNRHRADFEKAGIERPFNTHDLRRTAATELGGLGVSDELIERILNHAPRTVLGKHYNHARYLEPMRDALDKLAASIAATIAPTPSQIDVAA